MFLGLRTIIYPAPELDATKRWYEELLGIKPYFDQAFYVGFNVGGYELALDPHGRVEDGPRTYWGVPDADVAIRRLLEHGAQPHTDVEEVGDSIRVATVLDPNGSAIGVIENPHFKLAAPGAHAGPGR